VWDGNGLPFVWILEPAIGRWTMSGRHRFQLVGGMDGGQRRRQGFCGAQPWKGQVQKGFRKDTNMRSGLKYLTSALAAGAAAAAIAVAPVAMADPAPAQPAVVATASSAMAAGHIVQAGHGGGGGFHGGGFHGGGFHGGGWGGDRGGWHGDRGWGGPWFPWGWR
jgi:hypothetical protein